MLAQTAVGRKHVCRGTTHNVAGRSVGSVGGWEGVWSRNTRATPSLPAHAARNRGLPTRPPFCRRCSPRSAAGPGTSTARRTAPPARPEPCAAEGEPSNRPCRGRVRGAGGGKGVREGPVGVVGPPPHTTTHHTTKMEGKVRLINQSPGKKGGGAGMYGNP